MSDSHPQSCRSKQARYQLNNLKDKRQKNLLGNCRYMRYLWWFGGGSALLLAGEHPAELLPLDYPVLVVVLLLQHLLQQAFPQVGTKKEKEIFLNRRKFRRDRLQNHIWPAASLYITKYLRISSYIRKPFLIYDLATDPICISKYCRWGKFYFLFYQCVECRLRAAVTALILGTIKYSINAALSPKDCWGCSVSQVVIRRGMDVPN